MQQKSKRSIVQRLRVRFLSVAMIAVKLSVSSGREGGMLHSLGRKPSWDGRKMGPWPEIKAKLVWKLCTLMHKKRNHLKCMFNFLCFISCFNNQFYFLHRKGAKTAAWYKQYVQRFTFSTPTNDHSCSQKKPCAVFQNRVCWWEAAVFLTDWLRDPLWCRDQGDLLHSRNTKNLKVPSLSALNLKQLLWNSECVCVCV